MALDFMLVGPVMGHVRTQAGQELGDETQFFQRPPQALKSLAAGKPKVIAIDMSHQISPWDFYYFRSAYELLSEAKRHNIPTIVYASTAEYAARLLHLFPDRDYTALVTKPWDELVPALRELAK